MSKYSQSCQGACCKLCADYGKMRDSTEKNVVYLITSREGKPYVGITTTTLKHRMAQHRHAIKSGRGDGIKFIDYYRKHNFEAITVKTLYRPHQRGNIIGKLREKEAYFIKQYDSINNGLNSQY